MRTPNNGVYAGFNMGQGAIAPWLYFFCILTMTSKPIALIAVYVASLKLNNIDHGHEDKTHLKRTILPNTNHFDVLARDVRLGVRSRR